MIRNNLSNAEGQNQNDETTENKWPKYFFKILKFLNKSV